MKKILYLVLIVILATLAIGCSKSEGEDTMSIKSPTNNSLDIYGRWRIKSVKIFDEEINVFKDLDNINDKEIEFTHDRIDLIDNKYKNPSYKLKVVNKDYILSYESNLKIEPFMNGKERVDVISITSNNNMISEFILLEKDKGYIVYMGALVEVYKISDNITINTDGDINNNEDRENFDIDYYNSETGVMIALKKPRVVNEDGTFTSENYRTLWIPFKDGKLMPVIEKENIIFPRLNGIWKLKNKVLETENSREEYFEVTSVEGKIISTYEPKNKDTYKNITFIGSDYIGIEEYIGEDFKNVFAKYGVIPIDNINSNSGLNIEELYSKDIINKYKMEYEKALDNIYSDNNVTGEENDNNNFTFKIQDSKTIDYSNFTVKRKDGKWGLVGNLGIINEEGKSEEYLLNLRPNSKMLNYDSLIIPWKQLKGDIPFIRDAYISPNERIAIILFEDNLAIYEIKDKMLKGAPLANINIGNEEVIMAEWSTGAYVEKWSKVFDDGINITN